jgi:hypothetical protein
LLMALVWRWVGLRRGGKHANHERSLRINTWPRGFFALS